MQYYNRKVEQITETEAWRELSGLAGKRFNPIPADWMNRLVFAACPDRAWPILRDAQKAILRRMQNARLDGLQLDRSPRNKNGTGVYTLKNADGQRRPYRIQIRNLNPLIASCNCSDYCLNSFGICKHILTVVSAILKQEKKISATMLNAPAWPQLPFLYWDPVRPWRGAGDWLDRLRLVEPPGKLDQMSKAHLDLLLLCKQDRSEDDRKWWLLKHSHADQPKKRLHILQVIAEFLQSDSRTASDVAIERLLRWDLDKTERILQSRTLRANLPRHLKGLKGKLYAYQREGVTRFFDSGRLLLGDQMGLGKTVQAIAIAHTLMASDSIQRGLFIVPASLKNQWQNECLLFSELPVQIIDGNPQQRARIYRQCKRGILITNYEQVIRDFHLIEKWKPEFALLDEAQRIKNWATKTALYVKAIQPRFRLILTGTPMSQGYQDLFAQMRFLSPKILGYNSFYSFAANHLEYSEKYPGLIIA
ncbi:MAG: DEAD/DEAH box helicase family protein [Leptospiraceae bacterium]|nr:DEAD/DEAH box helicase family protein [Leptospiraceae bacterium]